ncbi:MAG: sigma-70 family RNA polymerase sigma factor [Verrucomicrobia bacterium]|nr:sigma-70 family RNA polymerase sigma factor [Verrucomicrobiota bacterium]
MNDTPHDWQATRWSLLARLKNWDDQESWREFFDAYGQLIYCVAIKAGLRDAEAQDVVQDTLLSVAKNIQKFRCDPAAGSFKAWLLQLTRWRILNQVKRRLPCAPGDSASPVAGDEPRTATIERVPDPASLRVEAIWDKEWERNLLEAAKARVQQQVSAEQFQMFELSVVQGWPVRGIVKLLGVSAGQVYLARHRIGKLLKKEIARLRSRL